MNYLIFDKVVSCDRNLAELPGSPAEVADVHVKFRSGVVQDMRKFEPLHTWLDDEKKFSMACARNGCEYLLEFPGNVQFHINTESSTIDVHPGNHYQVQAAKRLLIDQVIPRLVFHQGRAVFHASAVVLPNGSAVAFMGKTGRGKSTLAGAFQQSGCEVLTDDCLLLEKLNQQLKGLPAYKGLRLWPDSVSALGLDPGSGIQGGRIDGKLLWTGHGTEPSERAVNVSALFVLGDPAELPEGVDVEYKPLTGSAAMIALVEAAFVLDLISADAVRNNFIITGAIAEFGVRIYHLNFPRYHSVLPAVRELVVHVQQADVPVASVIANAC